MLQESNGNDRWTESILKVAEKEKTIKLKGRKGKRERFMKDINMKVIMTGKKA